MIACDLGKPGPLQDVLPAAVEDVKIQGCLLLACDSEYGMLQSGATASMLRMPLGRMSIVLRSTLEPGQRQAPCIQS